MRLNDRIAVITGAGGGIGRAIAASLARRGCHLALCDIDEHGLAETAALLAKRPVRCSTHRLDVADREQVAALPGQVVQAHGAVHLLVNNAGVALGGAFEQVSEADFDWLMNINFHGLVRMTRAFLPLLRGADVARIVNLSSVYGLISPPGQCAYSASKFAVRGFSNALRYELAGSPVGVTVVHPGGVATAIARNARVGAGASADEIARGQAEFQKFLRLPPERAGEIIAVGIERDAPRVLVGSDAKLVALLERLLPVSHLRVLEWLTGRARPAPTPPTAA
jgi:NAD(P)-dependent dehydrogenase (short-subunit alcohol dehydrogenase family)